MCSYDFNVTYFCCLASQAVQHLIDNFQPGVNLPSTFRLQRSQVWWWWLMSGCCTLQYLCIDSHFFVASSLYTAVHWAVNRRKFQWEIKLQWRRRLRWRKQSQFHGEPFTSTTATAASDYVNARRSATATATWLAEILNDGRYSNIDAHK